MRNPAWVLMGLGVLAMACGTKAKAQDVCVKLESAGVATNCREGKPTGIYSNAKDVAEFDVPDLAGKGGVVLVFPDRNFYDATVRSYVEMGSRNADHRAGNPDRLVFVAINEAASEELGEKAKAVVEGL